MIRAALILGIACAGFAGCASGPSYEAMRPPVGSIDPRDRGLQSKDVYQASDQLAADLLAAPELNASRDRWAVVVTGVKNETYSFPFSADIFIQRLKGNISRYGRDRARLIENRDAFRDLQDRELEGGPTDRFGQGGAPVRPGSAGVQPDYALYGVMRDLPNRGTNYYILEFTVTDLASREQVWSNFYEVRTGN